MIYIFLKRDKLQVLFYTQDSRRFPAPALPIHSFSIYSIESLSGCSLPGILNELWQYFQAEVIIGGRGSYLFFWSRALWHPHTVRWECSTSNRNICLQKTHSLHSEAQLTSTNMATLEWTILHVSPVTCSDTSSAETTRGRAGCDCHTKPHLRCASKTKTGYKSWSLGDVRYV